MSGPAPLRRGLAARFLGAGALPSAGVLAMVERGEGVGIDLPLSADAAPEAFAHRALGVLPALHLGLTPGVRGQAAVTVTSDLPALHGLEQTRTVLPQEDTRVEVRPGVARTAGVTVQNLRWLITGPTPFATHRLHAEPRYERRTLMNLTTLKARHLAARKHRDTAQAAVLGRVIGDVETQTKNRLGTDQDQLVTGVLADQVAAMLRERDQLAGLGRDTARIDAELTVLQTLDTEVKEEQARVNAERLARQLSPGALEAAIREAVAGGAQNIGAVMKQLKARQEGNYDGRLASEIARRILANG